MSVLGVKNWFENISNSAEELVLGRYPLEFLHFSQSAKWPVRDFSGLPYAVYPPRQSTSFDSPTTDISSRQVFPGFLGEEEYKLSPEVLFKIGQWASVADRAPPKTLKHVCKLACTLIAAFLLF
ncbi:hypothetical protein FCULG_00012142 [Fusarium culmorum]|uniref:Uncharacterized protein n=1 Tax=Fusarium culmorum TaxID=5516 RepID=A0A2T4GFH8_FUSCU|nr:hypothetical protein FCULG_00012142 [Fusarium culmorum]